MSSRIRDLPRLAWDARECGERGEGKRMQSEPPWCRCGPSSPLASRRCSRSSAPLIPDQGAGRGMPAYPALPPELEEVAPAWRSIIDLRGRFPPRPCFLSLVARRPCRTRPVSHPIFAQACALLDALISSPCFLLCFRIQSKAWESE